MSIVNISSENATSNFPTPKADGRFDNSEFTVKFKKPLTDCVGLQLLRAAIPLTYNVINKNDDIDGNASNVMRFAFQRSTDIAVDGAHTLESDVKIFSITLKDGTYDDDKLDELCLQLEQQLRRIDLTRGGTYNTNGVITGSTTDATVVAVTEGDDIYPGWGDHNPPLAISGESERDNAIAILRAGLYNYDDTSRSFVVYYDDVTRKVHIVHSAKKFVLLGYKSTDKETKENEDTEKALIAAQYQIGYNTDPWDGTIPRDPDTYSIEGAVYDNEIESVRLSQYATNYDTEFTTRRTAQETEIVESEEAIFQYIGSEIPADFTPGLDVHSYRKDLIDNGPIGSGHLTSAQVVAGSYSEFEAALKPLLVAELYRALAAGHTTSANLVEFVGKPNTISGNNEVENHIRGTIRTSSNGYVESLGTINVDDPDDIVTLDGDDFIYYLHTQVAVTIEGPSITDLIGVQTLYRTGTNGYTITDPTDFSNFDTMDLAAYSTAQDNRFAVVCASAANNPAFTPTYGARLNTKIADLVTNNQTAIDTAAAESNAAAITYTNQTAQIYNQEAAAESARDNATEAIVAQYRHIYTTPGLDAYWKSIEDLLAGATYNNNSLTRTSGRLQKVFGFYYDEHTAGVSRFFTQAGVESTSLPVNSGTGTRATLIAHLYPEPRGSKAIFLRITGPTLDQQNTETGHGDRIMIPIQFIHGECEHYLANTQSEIIPFKVPQTLTELTLRLEYGDENSLLGGSSDSLNGAHAYYRFKFYFKHQTNKI